MPFQEWTTAGSDSFTVPAGVTEIILRMRGAGAGSQGGSGGGGGAFVKKTISCTPSQSFNLSVGAGGTSGSNGGDTDWNSGEFIAGGGQGGTGGTVSGSGSPDISNAGGNGGSGTSCCETICDEFECLQFDEEDPPNCIEFGPNCVSSHEECTDYYGGGGASGSEDGVGVNGGAASCDSGQSGFNGGGGAAGTEGGNGGDGLTNSGITNGGGAGGDSTGFSGADGYIRVEWTEPPTDLEVPALEVHVHLVRTPMNAGASFALSSQQVLVHEVAFLPNGGVQIAAGHLRVQVNEVNSPVDTSTFLTLVGLQTRVHQVNPAMAGGAQIATHPLRVQTNLVDTPITTPPAGPGGSSGNSMKHWFNGHPSQGTDGQNMALRFWRSGLPSQPLVTTSPVSLLVHAIPVRSQSVPPPINAGAALPAGHLRNQVQIVGVSQIGGVNVTVAPMPVIAVNAATPQSEAVLALPVFPVETNSNIQSTTGGAGPSLGFQVQASLAPSLPTGTPFLQIGVTAESSLVPVQPVIGIELLAHAMPVSTELGPIPQGSVVIATHAMSVPVQQGFNRAVLVPELILSQQELDVDEILIELHYDTNLELSLQEIPVPDLYRIIRMTGGQSVMKFAEVERSSSSIVIYGSEPNQPFKFNPSAAAYRRGGPAHTMHLGRVKPSVVTINATFELLTPFAELSPNEFTYEAPGGFLRIWNEDVVQATIIPDGDTAAIQISAAPVTQVFAQPVMTSFALQRDLDI